MTRHDEVARLLELAEHGLLDQPVDSELEAVVRLAAATAGVPTATINLLDDTRQCQLATVGFAGADSARADSMCAVRLRDGRTVVVPDAREHPDHADNPWVTGERARVRFYASAPLVTAAGSVLGTLCVFDLQPRTLTAAQVALLEDAASLVVALFERRRQTRAYAHVAAEVDEQRELLALTLQEMEAHRELTDAVLETVDVGIVAVDATGRLTMFNRTARAWHGEDADPDVEPGEHAVRYRMLSADGRSVLRPEAVPIARALRDGVVAGAELLLAPHGRPAVRVVANGRALCDSRGRVLGAVVALTDVTVERQRQADLVAAHTALVQDNADLARRAQHDPLTGLPNRQLLHEHLRDVLDGRPGRAAERGASVGVLFIDLDGFKSVNDSLGHAAGARLLVGAARRLRACLRGRDLVARLGGDEFVMVCSDLDEPGTATTIAARVQRVLAEPLVLGGAVLEVRGSIGVAVSDDDSTCDGLLHAADLAMYRAKRAASRPLPEQRRQDGSSVPGSG